MNNKEKIIIKDNQFTAFFNGVKITVKCEDKEYRVYNTKGEFIGTAIGKNGRLKRDVII